MTGETLAFQERNLHSCRSPFLWTGITLANFKQFRKSAVSNDRLIRVDNDSNISFFISLSIVTGMLLGPIALFKLKVFITSSISSAVVGDKNNVFFFVFFFVCQERTEGLLNLRNFLSNFPAILRK